MPDGQSARAGARSSAAILVLLVAVIASAGLPIVHAQQSARASRADRLKARHSTATRFLGDYVSGVFARERDLATLTFTGPVSADEFDTITGQGGYRAAVLLDRRHAPTTASMNARTSA